MEAEYSEVHWDPDDWTVLNAKLDIFDWLTSLGEYLPFFLGKSIFTLNTNRHLPPSIFAYVAKVSSREYTETYCLNTADIIDYGITFSITEQRWHYRREHQHCRNWQPRSLAFSKFTTCSGVDQVDEHYTSVALVVCCLPYSLPLAEEDP